MFSSHDKKIVALGLMALMQSPEANNQNLLNEQSLMHLMKHLVSLLEDLRQQIESEDSLHQDSTKRTSKTPLNLERTTYVNSTCATATTKTLRRTRMQTR